MSAGTKKNKTKKKKEKKKKRETKKGFKRMLPVIAMKSL